MKEQRGIFIYVWSMLLFSQLIYVVLAFQKSHVASLSEIRLPSLFEPMELIGAVVAVAALLGVWQLSRLKITTEIQFFVIRMALVELVTIVGLILAMTSQDGTKMIPFFVASLAAMIILFPRQKT